VRGNVCNMVSGFYKSIYNLILDLNTVPDDVEKMVRDYVFRLLCGKFSLHDMTVRQRLSRLKYKDDDFPEHVRVARLWKKIDPVNAPQLMDNVEFVFVRLHGVDDKKARDICRPAPWVNSVSELDLDYYFVNKLQPTLKKLLKLSGWFSDEAIHSMLEVNTRTVTDDYPLLRYVAVAEKEEQPIIKKQKQTTILNYFTKL
jgi:DNA polymerase elongation subunit (family B)